MGCIGFFSDKRQVRPVVMPNSLEIYCPIPDVVLLVYFLFASRKSVRLFLFVKASPHFYDPVSEAFSASSSGLLARLRLFSPRDIMGEDCQLQGRQGKPPPSAELITIESYFSPYITKALESIITSPSGYFWLIN